MTHNKSLFDILKSQKSGNEQVNLVSERDEYLKALSDVYQNFRTWLTPGVKDNLITIQDTEISILEETLGVPYMAPCLRISFTTNKRVVEVVPVGTFFVGAWGRLDLRSGVRDSVLLRVKKKGATGYIWCFKVPPPSGRGTATYPPLAEDLFLEEIKRLIF